MTASALALAALLGGAVGAGPSTPPAPAAAGPETRPVEVFAIVVGVNDPVSADGHPLKYADDDAIALHALLAEAGAKSLLLIDPDVETMQLHPDVEIHAAPTERNVIAAAQSLQAEIDAAWDRGSWPEVWFAYSGHGDVEDGEGYMKLTEGRLWRTDLMQQVLEPWGAARHHVVIDACKSYFVVFDKGPGGQRQRFRGEFTARSGDDLPHTGFILSTSSDAESHEWARLQAGIFSYEVRSGLRGGADIDRDGRVSYRELAAFIQVANRGIPNARFRPDFLVVPPIDGPDVPALGWPGQADTLTVDAGWGRVYLEDALGRRLADAHPRSGAKIDIRLPAQRPLFVRTGDGSAEAVIQGQGPQTLASLKQRPVAVRDKGALHLAFQQLFSAPFGADDVKLYVFDHEPEQISLFDRVRQRSRERARNRERADELAEDFEAYRPPVVEDTESGRPVLQPPSDDEPAAAVADPSPAAESETAAPPSSSMASVGGVTGGARRATPVGEDEGGGWWSPTLFFTSAAAGAALTVALGGVGSALLLTSWISSVSAQNTAQANRASANAFVRTTNGLGLAAFGAGGLVLLLSAVAAGTAVWLVFDDDDE